MTRRFLALILAAGKGTRFKSNRIKVLHPIMGRPMLSFVVGCVLKLKPEKLFLVLGYQKEDVMGQFASAGIEFIHQKEQLGTAHAVMVARKVLEKSREKDVLVINGDLPLLRPETLRPMLAFHWKNGNSMTFLSAELENPTGFGRIIRSGPYIRVVEEKDATPQERAIKESNAGVYLFKIKDLLHALPGISNQNRKGEFYITDIHEILARAGKKIGAFKTPHTGEIIGINSRFEMAKATEVLRLRKIKDLTEKGVTVYDPRTTWIDLNVRVGVDTVIFPSVIIEGDSVIGKGCRLYPFVHIIHSRLGNAVTVLSSTVIEESTIQDEAQVGPFSRLRPKTVIRRRAKVGNFVEMKNTDFGSQSKAMHLTYLGDCVVKERVNIGAGTITCNFDGRKKHKTVIEEGAFIGSGTELVAPIKIGKRAYIGAGSTITRDVSPDSLAVARSRQIEKKSWPRRLRKK